MKAHFFCAAFAAFLLLGVTPSALHAQCSMFYCTSYLTYTGSELDAYVEYDDPSEVNALSIDGIVIGENMASETSFGDYDEYGDVMVTYDGPPPYNDVYYIEGDCYYGEDPSTYDGTTYSGYATVAIDPTGESLYSADFGQYVLGGITNAGGLFVMTLTGGPTGFYFDGGTVAESISGFDDGCYDEYPVQTYGAPAGLSGSVSGNQYQDIVSAPAGWWNTYSPLVSGSVISPCTFSDSESLSYNGAGYLSLSAGVGFYSTVEYYAWRGANFALFTP